jgi:hypothetical protein
MLAVGICGTTPSARGALQVTIGNLSLAPGATGTLDVDINSTSPSGDDLDTFGFEFRITTSRPTLLEFTPVQPDPYGNSSYVFFNNSLNQGPPSFPLGTVSSVGAQSNTYIGGDGTVTGSAHIGAANKLLLQLRVTAATGTLSPVLGDTFTISLISGANTSFTLDGVNVPFTSSPGTVTIAAPAAAPEPSSLVALCTGVLAGASGWLLTRRRAVPASQGQ